MVCYIKNEIKKSDKVLKFGLLRSFHKKSSKMGLIFGELTVIIKMDSVSDSYKGGFILKKYLALFLVLLLTVCVVFSAPVSAATVTSSFEEDGLSSLQMLQDTTPSVTSATLLSGDWYHSQIHKVVSDGTYLSTPSENVAGNSLTIKGNKSGVSFYTKLSGLEPYTRYEISFRYAAANSLYMGGSGVVLAEGSHPNYDNNLNYMPGANNTFYSARVDDTANKKVTYTFTTDANTEYFFSIRTVLRSAETCLTDFSFRKAVYKSDEITGSVIANNRWYCSESTTEKIDQHIFLVDNKVSLKGSLHYRALFTKLTGLKPYTKYVISMVDGNAEVEATNSGVVVANGNRPTFQNGVIKGDRLGTVTRSSGSRKTTISFTTNENTEYFLSVKFGAATNTSNDIVLSNFTATEWTAAEQIKGAIANGKWNTTGSATVSHNTSNKSVTVSSATNQTVYTTLTGLEHHKTYTFTFKHTAGNAELFGNPAYVVAGSSVSLEGNQVPRTYLCKTTNGSTATNFTITFTTNETNNEYTFVFKIGNISSVTLSGFGLTERPVSNFLGTAVRAATTQKEQGIRFKTKLDKSLLTEGINGCHIIEIGSIAAITDKLEGEPLSLEHKAAKKAVAYYVPDGIRRFWDEDEDYVYLAIALVGIEPQAYDDAVSVVPYLTLSNGTVIYGDVQTYCVYDVFRAILQGEVEEDKNTVESILEANELNLNFDAWQEVNPVFPEGESYFVSVRTANVSTGITLSNFSLKEGGVLKSPAVLLGNHWYQDQNDSYYTNGEHLSSRENNLQSNQIKIKEGWLTGYSYYTKLTGLKPNTTYQISFSYDVPKSIVAEVGVAKAEGEKPVYNESTHALDVVSNQLFGEVKHNESYQIITYTFTTDKAASYVTDGDATDDNSDISYGADVESETIDLSVYNASAPINTNYKGMNATIYHSFGFMDDRPSTEEQLETELSRLQNMGYKNCRTNFFSGWVFSSGISRWIFDSRQFKDFTTYCKAVEDHGMSVMLNQMWYLYMTGKGNSGSAQDAYLSGLNGSWGTGDWYAEQTTYADCVATEFKLTGNMNPYTSGSTNQVINGKNMSNGSKDTRMGTSSGDFNETVTNYFNRLAISGVRYGHLLSQVINKLRAAGVNNLDYLLYFTEPSYHYRTPTDPTGPANQEYLFVCRTIRNVIEKNGIRITHVGPNQGHVYSSGGLLDYVMDRDPDLFDVASAHFYPQITDANSDSYYNYTRLGINYYKSDISGSSKDWGEKEFWLDEMYAQELDTTDCRKTVPQTGIQTVIMNICAQQTGVDNTLSWMAFSQAWYQNRETSTEFVDGVHVIGMAPWIVESDVPYRTYYSTGLFARYNNSIQGGDAWRTSTYSDAGNDGLYIGAVKLPDGNITITVASTASTSKKFKVAFENALGKDLHRHIENTFQRVPDSQAKLSATDTTFQKVTTSLVDVIEPWSVHIYTTALGPCNK